MHQQQAAKELAKVKSIVEELHDNPQLTSKMLHELQARLGTLEKQKAYSLRMMHSSSVEALEFGNIIGESAKMVGERKRGLCMPPRGI